MRTHTIDVEQLASGVAGNWQRFDSFSWWGRDDELIPDPERWCIVYVSNRDSGLVDQSNAAAIEKLLDPFTETDPPNGPN